MVAPSGRSQSRGTGRVAHSPAGTSAHGAQRSGGACQSAGNAWSGATLGATDEMLGSAPGR